MPKKEQGKQYTAVERHKILKYPKGCKIYKTPNYYLFIHTLAVLFMQR